MDDDRRVIARQVAEKVAPSLGDGWSVDDAEHLRDHYGTWLQGPDDARLFLRVEYNNLDRLEVSGGFPPNESSPVIHDSIGVSVKRGPDVIAREIKRRLLPLYLAELARINASNGEDMRTFEARGRLAKLLADAVRGTVDESTPAKRGTRVRFHHQSGAYGDMDIRYRGDGVDLELRGTTPDLALSIAALIGAS